MAPPDSKPNIPDSVPSAEETESWVKKHKRGIMIAGAAVLAVAIPIAAKLIKDKQEEEDTKILGNPVIDRVVGWVKEVKAEVEDDKEEDLNVPDFGRTQSL